jgi:hypothetical protein
MTANAHHQTRFTAGGRPELIVRFATCQWITGDGPFSEADKCGAPVAEPSAAYCSDHARRAVERARPAEAEADASNA